MTNTRSSIVWIPGLALSMMACHGQRANTAASSECAPVPAEFLIAGPVFRDCAVDRKAVPPSKLPPIQMALPPTRRGCSKVAIDVVIDTAGRPVTPTARVVESNDPQFQESVLASVGALRYKPAVKGGVRVPQLVRYERQVALFTVVSSSGGGVPTPRPSRGNVPRC